MKSLHVIFIIAALAVAHVFFGGGDGTRLIYVLPTYALLGLSGTLAFLTFWKAPGKMDRACLLSAVVFAVYFAARMATSPSAWLAGFDFYPLLAALVLYFVTALVLTGSGPRFAIVCALIVLAVAHVAVGFWQFARDPEFHPLLPGGRGSGFRASGFFISPNHLAGFLETALLFATSLFFWAGFRAPGKILTAYIALLCLAGLLLTGSRGGYLSTGVGLTAFTCLSVWTLRRHLSRGLLPRMAGIAAAIALLGGVLMFAAEHSFGIRARTSTVFVSSDVRLELWEAAWKQFQLAPIFGTGSRTYLYYGRMFRAPLVQNDPIFAHSDWLETLAEYGIVGVLLAVVFFIAHLRHGWQRLTRMAARFSTGLMEGPDRRALALHLGTLSAIAACLVHAAMDFNLHITANALLAAFLFGTLASRRTRWDETPSPAAARTLHAIPGALGVCLLAVSVPRIPGELLAETARGKFAEGKIPQAQKLAGLAIARGVRNPDLYFQIGEVQRMLGYALGSGDAQDFAFENAHDAYAEALAIFPFDAGILVRDAWALSRLGRFEEAEPLLARAKELDPKKPLAWVCAAVHWNLRDRPVEAFANWQGALARDYRAVFPFLNELHETLDPQDLEKRAQSEAAAAQK